MTRFKPLLVSVLLAAFIPASAAGLDTARLGDVEITPLPMPAEAGSSGYSVMSARLRNTGNVAAEVSMRVAGKMFGARGRSAFSENSLTLQPGAEALLETPFPNIWQRAEVEAVAVDGKPLRNAGSIFPTCGGNRPATVMLELNADPDHIPLPSSPEQAAARARARLQLEQSFDTVSSAYSPMADWSADPLAYTGFAMISVPENDFSAAPESVRRALEQYMLLGGTLEILGSKRAFARESMFGSYIGSAALPEPLPRTAFGSAPVRKPELFDLGLSETAGTAAILGILAVFSAAAAALALLLRRRFRAWLFATIPAASLAAAAGIVAATLAWEGSTPRLAIESRIAIDSATGCAAIESEYLFFAPMLDDCTIEFSGDTLVMNSDARSYIWNNGKLRLDGLLDAHTPVRLSTRRVFKTSARIELAAKNDASVTVINRLGANLSGLICRVDGEKYSLMPMELPFMDGGTATLRRTGGHADSGPDGFEATMDFPPFVEPGLTAKPGVFKSRAVISGNFAGKEQK